MILFSMAGERSVGGRFVGDSANVFEEPVATLSTILSAVLREDAVWKLRSPELVASGSIL
jgi:hypothetical protein